MGKEIDPEATITKAAAELEAEMVAASPVFMPRLNVARLNVPDWLETGITVLIHAANQLIPGQKRGASKKRWVVEAVRELLREFTDDVPEWVGHALETVLVDFAVEFVFKQLKRQGAA